MTRPELQAVVHLLTLVDDASPEHYTECVCRVCSKTYDSLENGAYKFSPFENELRRLVSDIIDVIAERGGDER